MSEGRSDGVVVDVKELDEDEDDDELDDLVEEVARVGDEEGAEEV